MLFCELRDSRAPMSASHNPQQNRLLAALPAAERERLWPHLQLIPMPLGEVLYESGDVLRYVYFPIDSIVSLLYVLADGASAEISVVGNEGLIGIALFMGGETTPSRASTASPAAVHAGPDHADGADRGVQPTPLGGPAIVPLAVALSRSVVIQSADHDSRAHRQHARRTPRGCDRSGRQIAQARRHPLRPGPDHGAGPAKTRAAVLCYAVVKKEE
jgi:hypothetical protein